MKRIIVVCIGMSCLAVAADGLVDGKYVVTVPPGETRVLTSEDVAAFSGYDLVKSGEGTLEGGAVMKDFTGDLYITNGVYSLRDAYGCGTNDVFVFGSGTLHVARGGSSDWNNGRGKPAMELEGTLYFEGTGFAGQGVISNTVDCAMIVRKAVMTGDALVSSARNNYFQFRYGSFDMGGHTLTFHGSGGTEASELGFVSSKNIPLNFGHLDIYGGIEFQDWTTTGTAANTVTLRPGAKLVFSKAYAALGPKLICSDGTKIEVSGSEFGAVGVLTHGNRWVGPVVLSGGVTNNIKADRHVTFSGVLSGPGGFLGGKGGWLQLANTENTFSGGVEALGPSDADGLSGGLALFGNGCVPADGGAITLGRSALRLYDPIDWSFRQLSYDLPALVATGPALVTNMTDCLGVHTVKSVTKTGTGTLTLAEPMAVLGTTDVQGGTLRFGRRVPSVSGGLLWKQAFKGDAEGTAAVETLDSAGAYYAYNTWPNGISLFDDYEIEFWYEGFIRVPGESGDTVTCNFVSSIIREAKVVIGDVTVSHVKDNRDVLNNKMIGYKRFSVGKPVTLQAGWQPIRIYLHTWYDSSRGPAANTDLGWVANFGLGVDWQGRCETNSAHYAKFLDPGDGSFLRVSLETKEAMDPAVYRPVFKGPVAFASGTTFDVNDVEPFTPVVFPSLTGLPTVTNGAINVKGTVWTVRASDLLAGTPLTVTAGSRVAFEEGAELVLDFEGEDELALSRRLARPCPILRVAAGGRLVNPPSLRRPDGSFWRLVAAADGRGYDLVYRPGFSVIVR